MRGEDSLESKNIDPVGITPAHAGRSLCRAIKAASNRDHPRACGEKREKKLGKYTAGGSPPRMRGED